MAGRFANKQFALFKMIIVREHFVGFGRVAHIFLNAEIGHPCVKMQRRAHGDGRQVGCTMAAHTNLIKARQIGNAT